jgi:hypothetical protein
MPMFERGTLAACILTMAAALAAGPVAAQDRAPGTDTEAPKDFSPAERLLFMSEQLARIKPPTTLRYTFTRSGSAEPPLDGKLQLLLTKAAGGRCCAAEVKVMDPALGPSLPAVEKAEGNPVLLFFLDRDVREMRRLTRGAESYYRKRIRMAIYQGARISDVTLGYQGKSVRGKRVEISPYDDDPARERFTKHARKSYRFDLSDELPGGIHSVRTVMLDADNGKPPMIVEELRLEGAAPSKDGNP